MMDGDKPPADMMMMEQRPTQDEVANGCCVCFSFKCCVITLLILIFVDLFFQCINVYYIYDNEHFDPIFWQVYVGILFLYAVALVLACIYLFPKDSPETRAVVPWAFLVASIAAFALFFWIIIYVDFLYDDDKVYV